jgi:hypothetical protein
MNRFLWARGVGDSLANPSTVNLWCTPGWDAQGVAAQDWKALLLRAKQEAAWLIIVIHGVGGDHLSCSPESHEALLEALKNQGNAVWVAPFGEVAARVDQFQRQHNRKPELMTR